MMVAAPTLSIGALAKATDTKVVTIRYYERIGLLPAPARSASNYRVYAPPHLERLRFIRRCRDLGFTLDEVRELLRLSSEEGKSCAEVDRIAAVHLADTERKIADLTRLAARLRRIINRCEGGGVIADCRIIESLAPDGDAGADKDG